MVRFSKGSYEHDQMNIRQTLGCFSFSLHFRFSLKLYLNFREAVGSSGPATSETCTEQNCQSRCALLCNLRTARIQMPSSVLQNIKTGI